VLRFDDGVADLDRPLLVDERGTDLADHYVIFEAVDEVVNLSLGADGPGHPGGELRRVVVGHAHVAGPLAGEDGVGRLARDLAEHDRHVAILRLHGQPISFRSSAVRLVGGDARLRVDGDLTISGSTPPITPSSTSTAKAVSAARFLSPRAAGGSSPSASRGRFCSRRSRQRPDLFDASRFGSGVY